MWLHLAAEALGGASTLNPKPYALTRGSFDLCNARGKNSLTKRKTNHSTKNLKPFNLMLRYCDETLPQLEESLLKVISSDFQERIGPNLSDARLLDYVMLYGYTVLYNTMLYYTTLVKTMLCHAMLFHICYAMLCLLHYTTLHHTMLHYTTLHDSAVLC